MPTTWSMPNKLHEAVTGAAQLQRRFHGPLHDAGVRVLILFARNEDGPALKKGGRACAALVRVLPLKWRVVTGYDALIEIDDRAWADAVKNRRDAILFHELKHLELVEAETEDGRLIVARDDLGRPKLRLRDGDFDPGDGFVETIELFGEDALEAANVQDAYKVVSEALDQSFSKEANP